MKKHVIILLVALTCNIGYSQVSLDHYALAGVTIIDANHPKPLEHQTIVVKNKVIDQIFADGTKRLPDSVTVIILNGKYIIPGLIDTHVHLATDPSNTDNRASTLDVLNRMLYSGITSVRDMAGDARTLAGLSRDALVNDIISPNIYFSVLMAGPEFFKDERTVVSTSGGVPGNMPYMRAISDSVDLQIAEAEAKGTGATGIKLYANLSAQIVEKIVAEAKKQKMQVWAHAWLLPARPSDLIYAGVGSLSHASLMIGEIFERKSFDSVPDAWKKAGTSDQFWKDSVASKMDKLFDLMKEHNTILDATLATYQMLAEQIPSRKWQYELSKRITASAYKAGVKICSGTDDDQSKFVQYELKLLVKDAGFSNIDALIAATKNAADAIGIGGTHGTIELNKAADFVILDKNPLNNLDNLDTVFLVIKAGRMFEK